MSSWIDTWMNEAPRVIFEGKLKKHTARKDHVCTACGKVIPAGTQYWSHVIMDDEDGFQYSKTHRIYDACRFNRYPKEYLEAKENSNG